MPFTLASYVSRSLWFCHLPYCSALHFLIRSNILLLVFSHGMLGLHRQFLVFRWGPRHISWYMIFLRETMYIICRWEGTKYDEAMYVDAFIHHSISFHHESRENHIISNPDVSFTINFTHCSSKTCLTRGILRSSSEFHKWERELTKA